MTDELNERLAKAVGFIPCDCEENGEKCYYCMQPNGQQGGLPPFTTSMDACIKWIWPYLDYIEIHTYDEKTKVACIVGKPGTLINEWGSIEDIAKIFCLAADKYFEVSK